MAERPHSELLADFVSESPTPWHAAAGAARILAGEGFVELDATRPFDEVPDRGFVLREGSLVAWDGLPGVAEGRVRSIGAHTDSPGLRIRPRPDIRSAATNQLAVEVYGGALVNSWLDRDLTIAGRVVVRDGDAPGGQRVELVHPEGPLARVPQLAIHLDREVNTAGLKLNPQQHLTPLWGLPSSSRGDLRAWLAEIAGPGADVLGWDLCLVDTQPPELLGESRELLCSPRLDDLACCWGAIVALSDAGSSEGSNVVVLNDHEEVGSSSSTGAAGAWFEQVLERLAAARGVDRPTLLARLADSTFVSADMAHATHPNYPERHDANHGIELAAGPVIKHNANQRYATDALGAAEFGAACATADVPVQEYSHRNDIPCGSTIGPVVAARLAMRTVDVGMPQLSMHSIRELMAVADVAHMTRSFSAWFAG